MLRCHALNAAMQCTGCCDAMQRICSEGCDAMQRMLRCHLANVAMPCSECCHAVQRMLRCCAASAAMLCSECCDAACAANAMQQMMRYHATPHHDLDIHITPPHSSCCVVGSAPTLTHIPEQRHLSMPSFIMNHFRSLLIARVNRSPQKWKAPCWSCYDDDDVQPLAGMP